LNSGQGHIVSPNYPLPVQETLECYYKIYVEQGSRISINILDLQLVTDDVPGLLCNDDFLEVCTNCVLILIGGKPIILVWIIN